MRRVGVDVTRVEGMYPLLYFKVNINLAATRQGIHGGIIYVCVYFWQENMSCVGRVMCHSRFTHVCSAAR